MLRRPARPPRRFARLGKELPASANGVVEGERGRLRATAVGQAVPGALPREAAQPRWRGWVEALRRSGAISVLAIFLFSKLIFYAAVYLSIQYLPPAKPWSGQVVANARPGINAHWHWDTIYYYTISVGGYGESNEAAALTKLKEYSAPRLSVFFPGLPVLIHATTFVLNGFRDAAQLPLSKAELTPLLSGILVVNVMALLAFWHLYQIAREEYDDEGVARRAVFYAALFPVALYYAVPYNEALFLAALTGTFLAARRRQWLLAGVWAAIASGTRLAGTLLLPVLALEIYLAWRRNGLPGWERWRALAALLLAPVGMLLFVRELWIKTGDPRAWFRAYKFWRHDIILPPTTLWRGLRFALFPNLHSDHYEHFIAAMGFLVVATFVTILLVSLRRWRPSYILYGLLLFTLILSNPLPGSRVMFSLARYAMIFFPVYLALAYWGRRKAVHWAIVAVWVPFFALFAALYARWYIVS